MLELCVYLGGPAAFLATSPEAAESHNLQWRNASVQQEQRCMMAIGFISVAFTLGVPLRNLHIPISNVLQIFGARR